MNVLQGVPVPLQLVCRKQLTLLRVVIEIDHDTLYEHTYKKNSCRQM